MDLCKHQYIPTCWERKVKEGQGRETVTQLMCQFCGHIRSYISFIDDHHKLESIQQLMHWNKEGGYPGDPDVIREHFLTLVNNKMPIADAMHQTRMIFKLFPKEVERDLSE